MDLKRTKIYSLIYNGREDKILHHQTKIIRLYERMIYLWQPQGESNPCYQVATLWVVTRRVKNLKSHMIFQQPQGESNPCYQVENLVS